ncbi:L-seryl-tRNA(Sec) selenium transferase [Aurantivibrio infirmus]
MSESKAHLFSKIPSVDLLLQSEKLARLSRIYGHVLVRNTIRDLFSTIRSNLHADSEIDLSIDSLVERVEEQLEQSMKSSLVPVFNLTGTVIHTNLGRSVLPQQVIDAMAIATQACNLEFDLKSGKRGDRDNHIEKRLCELTGAEAATVVNNNAAAVLITLNTLAINKNVPVSRGELVEIGGSFRVPEIISSAGCLIQEVGTTNRTHLNDYEKSIDENTALVLKVHSSNYQIQGFTKSVSESELAKLCTEKGVPLVSDLGSGSLVELGEFGLPKEPLVRDMIDVGVDVVTFSGDKLMGGPQAGFIVGRKKYIDLIKKNPLKRALRVDKITIAAIDEVLKLYASPKQLVERLPSLRLLSRTLDDINLVANKILVPMTSQLEAIATISTQSCQSQIGSGALPVEVLDSVAICIEAKPVKGKTDRRLNQIALAFRQLPKPVVGRVNDGKLLFDLRCLEETEEFINQLNYLNVDI